MYEVGMLVMVKGGIELYSLDSKCEVIATKDVVDNAMKMATVKEIVDGYYLLDGLNYSSSSKVFFSEEWLIPCDEDYRIVCEHCGGEFSYHDVVFNNGKAYCKTCYEQLPICSSCGKIVDTLFNTIDGEVCEECIQREARVRSYDYLPDVWNTMTVDEEDNSLLIGAEIEIDKGSGEQETMKDISSVMGKTVIYEHDGSLSNGFEIVTHPFSYNFWHEKVDYVNKMFDAAKSHGYKAHDTNTCGLHLHVDKEQLATTDRTRDEVIDNILLIMETFMEEIIEFSRRHNTNYAKFLQDCTSVPDELTMKFIRRYKEDYSEKYRALNFAHRNTIEFRMFKGTLNLNTFMASIEFVNNIVDIARFGDIQGLTWEDIINHNSEKTSYIKEYNETRGITSTKTVQVLSDLEVNRDKYTIDKFANGNFGIQVPSNTKIVYYLLGVLRALNVKTEDGKNILYEDIASTKIKVRNGKLVRNARTKVYTADDILDVWEWRNR